MSSGWIRIRFHAKLINARGYTLHTINAWRSMSFLGSGPGTKLPCMHVMQDPFLTDYDDDDTTTDLETATTEPVASTVINQQSTTNSESSDLPGSETTAASVSSSSSDVVVASTVINQQSTTNSESSDLPDSETTTASVSSSSSGVVGGVVGGLIVLTAVVVVVVMVVVVVIYRGKKTYSVKRGINNALYESKSSSRESSGMHAVQHKLWNFAWVRREASKKADQVRWGEGGVVYEHMHEYTMVAPQKSFIICSRW